METSDTGGAEDGVPARGSVPRCSPPDASASQLTDYAVLRATDPALHWVDVRVDAASGQWMPVARIDMPLHHATRIAWTNLDHFAPLEAAATETLRFTFRVLSRDIEHRADENVFLVEYRARIEMVCSTSAPEARVRGVLAANVELDTTACPGLTSQVVDAARALAECGRDDECTIIDFGACDIEGLGCHFVPANRNRDGADLRAALYSLETHPCPSADCDCPTPPTSARCDRGHCTAR